MTEVDVWNAKNPSVEEKDATRSIDIGGDPFDDRVDQRVPLYAHPPVVSHILQDGTHVPAPPFSDFECTRFFERSVARHGLLREDLESSNSKKVKHSEEDEQETSKKPTSSSAPPPIHPLARASALLQANGINELNRAINLHSLVATGEYFSLSNIVDPSLDPATAKPSNSNAKEADARTLAAGSTHATSDASEGASITEARIRAVYILQRKRDLFRHAAAAVKSHRRRIMAAIASQQHLDRRWRQWRRRAWRLVAPEHGSRARPHPVQATEVLCADVDVYQHHQSKKDNPMGRLASHVPRYATLQLSSDYTHQAGKRWTDPHRGTSVERTDDDVMDVDTKDDEIKVDATEKNDNQNTDWEADTKAPQHFVIAQPYVVADPSIANDVDGTKATMLTLQFAIENTATGYCERVCIEEPASVETTGDESTSVEERQEDEKLLLALQHSLFCAKLFESMRRELAPDTDHIGQVRSASSSAPTQSVAWLTGQSQEGNFLPAPSMMLGAQQSGLCPICVVHVHEGDFKVLLDDEYTLQVRLVESAGRCNAVESQTRNQGLDGAATGTSGSQSPSQLLFLCRALLLHAQETYHRYSIRLSQEKNQTAETVHKTKDVVPSSMTLQKCISLGAKLLFEARIRKTLRTVKNWLASTASVGDDSLQFEWLMLSVFDLASHFTVSFRSWYLDAAIECDELTVTRFGTNGDYRKAKFHSDKEFELYLKTCLRRVLKQSKPAQGEATVPSLPKSEA